MTRLLIPLLFLSSAAHAGDGKFTSLAKQGKDLWATMSTSQGDIVLRLFSKDAPVTVANFGEVVSGYPVVEAISRMNGAEKAQIKKLTITDKAPKTPAAVKKGGTK